MDAKELICKIAGSEDNAKRIWEEVRQNRKTLDACPIHDFSIDLAPEHKVGKNWKCSKCSGVVSYTEKHWYEAGLKHGKGLI